MKPYGSKTCLIRPCTCCHSEAKVAKFKGNKARARREAKKELNEFQRNVKRGKESSR